MESFVTVRGFRKFRQDGRETFVFGLPGTEYFLGYFQGNNIITVWRGGREDLESSFVTVPRAYLLNLLRFLTETEKKSFREFGVIHSASTLRLCTLVDYGNPCSVYLPGLQEALLNWTASLVLQGIRETIAARSLQRQFREAIANPCYQMCKNRLLREFESMAS